MTLPSRSRNQWGVIVALGGRQAIGVNRRSSAALSFSGIYAEPPMNRMHADNTSAFEVEDVKETQPSVFKKTMRH